MAATLIQHRQLANGIPISKLATIANNTILGNNSGDVGVPTALSAANVRTLLSLVVGTDVQAYDSDLSAIAGLTANNDDIIQRKSGAWASRTIAQVKTDLSLSGTNSGDVTLAGESYISIASQVITANMVNLSGSHVTGTLAAARFPALSGHITTSAGSLATTIAAGVVTFAMLATAAWSDDTTLAGDSSTVIPTQHAVKTALDNLQAGLRFKQQVAVASIANVTISNPGTSTFDGVVLSSGDRILLKNQSTASQNGIYVFNGSGVAMTRATDADAGSELVSATIPVVGGTTNADTWWTITNDTITVGSTSITFTQTGGAGTYAAGSGITLTGNSFSISASAITNSMLAGSIAASKLVGSDIATVGTITAGTWNGTVVSSTYGGTGINNAGRTLTIATNSGTLAFAAASKTLTINDTYTLAGSTGTLTFQGTDTYVGRATSDTLLNKTLTSPVVNVGSDATGDIYYRNSGGAFTRLPIGTNGRMLLVVSGLPSWVAIANKEISALERNVRPDNSGLCWFEPMSILATNDFFDVNIIRFGNAGNDAQPSTRIGLHGQFTVPLDYVGGGVFHPIWTSTVTSGNRVWDLDYRTVGGDDTTSLDQSSTEQSISVTDAAPGAAWRRLTPTLTPTAGNFSPGETVLFTLFLDGTDAADTLAANGILYDLRFEYSSV